MGPGWLLQQPRERRLDDQAVPEGRGEHAGQVGGVHANQGQILPVRGRGQHRVSEQRPGRLAP